MAELNIEKCSACSLGPPDWRYQCNACANVFEMPSPSGPADEKSRTCPKCGSHKIERTGLIKSEACPPGG